MRRLTPEWMTVSASGLITGTPTNDDVGSHDVTVKVTDSAGESDTKTFTLTINNMLTTLTDAQTKY